MDANSTSREGKPWTNRTRLEVDYRLIAELMRSRCSGNSSFRDAWEARFEDVPDRKTVDNWQKKSAMPRTLKRFLRLASVLDCDPFLLLSHHLDSEFTSATVLDLALGVATIDGIQRREMYELFGPRRDWPNVPAIRKLTNDTWHVREFAHTGERLNYYQTVEIIPQVTHRPLAFHFAYRIQGSPVWYPYGTLSHWGERAILNNFNVPTDLGLSSKTLHAPEPLTVSTLFGFGLCNFRVTSVHPFRLSLSDRPEEILRFE